MSEIILELTEREAYILESMIQASLATYFTEKIFDKCLKEGGDCAKTFLVINIALEKIRDRLKEKMKEKHNRVDIVKEVESMLNNEKESKR